MKPFGFLLKIQEILQNKTVRKFAKTKRVKVRTRIWTNKQFKMRVEKKIRKPTYVSTFLETFLALLEYENVNFRWSLRANSSWNTRIRWIRYLLSKTISLSSCAIRKSKLVLPAEVILRINPRKWGKARVTEGRKSFMWPTIIKILPKLFLWTVMQINRNIFTFQFQNWNSALSEIEILEFS